MARLPSDEDTGKLGVPEGFHAIPDWTALLVDLPDMVGEVMDGGEITRSAPNDLLALAKNTIRTGDGASLSRIFANIYTCAMYLLCLCDPANVEVSRLEFTYHAAIKF
jgi:hypothetical protein